jgi:Mg-chelatase subunit ChlD
MVNWATKRKWTYLSIFFIVYLIVFLSVYFIYFYKPANCFDSKKNGSELGIDCGGNCVKLCQNQNIPPIIHWSRAFEISQNSYGLVAYIENSNFDSGAGSVPYVFKVYDDKQNVIFEKRGLTFIPVAKIFAVYEGPVFIDKPIKNVSFEFERSAEWKKGVRSDSFLKVNRIRLTQEVPYPRVDASLENVSLNNISNIEAVAIVYDNSGNAVAVSRTFVDSVPKESYKDVVFTWQNPFAEQFDFCEATANVSVIIDRSGSMASDAKDPPEPLSSIKDAAKTFLDLLGNNNKVSVVSFANNASLDQEITQDFSSANQAIENIAILSGSVQQTNIGDALYVAGQSLSADSADRQVIILLTDGIPTEPIDKNNKDYPKIFAKEQADMLLSSGFEIHTIGLGNELDEELLQSLSSNPSYFYKVFNADQAEGIYKRIAQTLCKKNPVIEIIPRIYPQ